MCLGGLAVVDLGTPGAGVEDLFFLGFLVAEGLGLFVVLGGVGTAVASTNVGRVMVGWIGMVLVVPSTLVGWGGPKTGVWAI